MSDAEAVQGIVRPFDRADLLPVAVVERMVYGSGGYELIVIRQLFDLFAPLAWVAEDAGKVVGFVFGAVALGGDEGWILNFAVLPHYRRQGMGRRLLDAELAALAATGVRRVRTTAEHDNAQAQRLLRALGFEYVGVGEDYYGDERDRYLFEMRL